MEMPTNNIKQINGQRICCCCGLMWKNTHKCPAIGKICKKCGDKGHYARVCISIGETNMNNETNATFRNNKRKLKTMKGGRNRVNINNNDPKNPNCNIGSEDIVKINNSDKNKATFTKLFEKKQNTIIEGPPTKEEWILQTKNEADNYYKQKNYHSALIKYSQLIKQCPDTEIYYGNCAACHIMMDNYEIALKDAKKSIELNSKYIKGHKRVIKSAMALGNIIEAKSALNEFQKYNPNNVLLMCERKKIQEINIYMMNIDNAIDKKNYNEALNNIDRALKICTHCVEYKIKKGDYLINLKRYDEAKIITKDILNYDRSNVDAKCILGICMYYLDFDKAVSYLKNIIRLAPDNSKIIAIYKKAVAIAAIKDNGNNAFRKKNYTLAYKHYTEGLKIDPENKLMQKKLYYNQAQASYVMDKIQRSINECTRALDIDPIYTKALMRRGQCYIDMKEYDDAIIDLRKAYHYNPIRKCENLLKNAEKLLNEAKRNYHGILGVKKNASQCEIKSAYKKKAMLHHPDRHVNSTSVEKVKHEKLFKQITHAYRRLMNDRSSNYNGANDPFDCHDDDDYKDGIDEYFRRYCFMAYMFRHMNSRYNSHYYSD